MKKHHHTALELTLLTAITALLALAGFTLLAAPVAPTPAPEGVLLTGWLHVEDRTVQDLVLVVEVEDMCLYVEVESTGRFNVMVPEGSRALLSFQKPGHLPKEVVVDTHNALRTARAQRINRKVKFDVVLEPFEKRPGRKYDGPVGSLSFVNGSGTMKVKHDLRVVADQ